jgi:hypothetical protein
VLNKSIPGTPPREEWRVEVFFSLLRPRRPATGDEAASSEPSWQGTYSALQASKCDIPALIQKGTENEAGPGLMQSNLECDFSLKKILKMRYFHQTTPTHALTYTLTLLNSQICQLICFTVMLALTCQIYRHHKYHGIALKVRIVFNAVKSKYVNVNNVCVKL